MEGEKGDEVRFAFQSLFMDIRENLQNVHLPFNSDLSDNILLRGIPATTKRVMEGNDCKKCKADKKGKSTDTE